MRRCLRDPTFSRFDTIPECDRQTHRHRTTAYTALSIASRGKNEIWHRLGATCFHKLSQLLQIFCTTYNTNDSNGIALEDDKNNLIKNHMLSYDFIKMVRNRLPLSLLLWPSFFPIILVRKVDIQWDKFGNGCQSNKVRMEANS